MQDDHTFICLLVRGRNGGFFPLQKYLVEVILQFRYQKAFSDCIYLTLSPLRLLTCFSFQPRQSTGFDIQRNRATHLGKREEYWGFSWNEIFQEEEARKLILKSESRCWGISWEYVNGCSSFNLISSAEQDRKWRLCWNAHMGMQSSTEALPGHRSTPPHGAGPSLCLSGLLLHLLHCDKHMGGIILQKQAGWWMIKS